MKKYLINLIAILLAVGSMYIAYQYTQYLVKSVFGLGRFSSDIYLQIYTFSLYLETLLFIIAGIAFLMKKKWSIIVYWIAIVLPILITTILPAGKIIWAPSYLIFLINAVAVAFLSTQWNKLNTNLSQI